MVLMRGNARNRDALSALSFLAHATLVPPDVLLQPQSIPREPPPPNRIVAMAAAEEGQRDAHGLIILPWRPARRLTFYWKSNTATSFISSKSSNKIEPNVILRPTVGTAGE
jgi:hypothetical protein